MATYYVDFENGNDANNGLSFANRRKTFPTATLFGGDSVRIMASPAPTLVGSGYISPIRNPFRGSDYSLNTFYASTTLGQSYFVNFSEIVDGDIINIWQNSNNIGLNGTWRITKIGNNCYLNGYTAPSNTTYSQSTGNYYKYTPSTIYLDTAVTKNIASTGGDGRSAWTASANVSAFKSSGWSFFNSGIDYTREGSIYDQIAITANFTTGKAAYYPTGTLDLSGYQQVSFYIRITSGVLNVSNLSLRLCSDTTGDTTVNTISIPALFGTTNNPWIPITVDLGTNLGSSIQSIALYVDSDQGAQTVNFSNIIACKASSSPDSLTLNSLVGLNTANDLFWHGVESINERILILSSRGPYQKHSYYSNPGVYFSQSGSVNIYKRQPINRLGSSSYDIQLNSPSSASTSNRVTVSGGWNRTDMSTQDGITFLDKCNYQNYGLFQNYNYYYSLNSLGFVRYANNWYLSGASYSEFTGNLYSIDSSSTGISFFWSEYLVGNAKFISSGNNVNISSGQNTLSGGSYTPSFYTSGGYDAFIIQSVNGSTFDTIKCYYGMFGISRFSNSSSNTITNLEVRYGGYNFSYGNAFEFYSSSNGNIISNLTISHILSGLYLNSVSNNIFSNFNTDNDNLLPSYSPMSYAINNSSTNNYVLSGTVDKYLLINSGNLYTKNLFINTGAGTELSLTTGAFVYSKNHDNVAGVDKTFFSGGIFEKSTTYRKTASGYSWKFTITTSSYTSTAPAEISLAKVAVQANSLVTLKLWVYRTGTGIVGGLRVKGGFVTGISSDVTSYGTGTANVWEEVTVTCTPTEDAVLDVRAVAYYNGNTNHNVYIDDFSATQ